MSLHGSCSVPPSEPRNDWECVCEEEVGGRKRGRKGRGGEEAEVKRREEKRESAWFLRGRGKYTL